MGRNGSVKKETALEALFRAKQVLGWKERPRPSQKNFESIVVTVNLWHGKNYWRKNKLSHKGDEYKKKRDAMLHSVSVWLDRRNRRGHPSKFVDSKLLSKWEQEVITAARGNNNTNKETTIAGKASAKPHKHGIHCGHRPVLHKCPKDGGHIDFLVDGTLECRHRSNSLSCCYDTTGQSYCGSLDLLDLDCSWGSLDETDIEIKGPCGEHNHLHGLDCGHRPVLHKCPQDGGHVDFMVDGALECQHQSKPFACCFDEDQKPRKNSLFEMLGEDEVEEWGSLIGGLTDKKILPVSSSPRGNKESSGFNKKQHGHSMHCGHRPVLPKCPKTGGHVDFIVDGKLSCRHNTRDMTCCSDQKKSEILIGENDPMEWDVLTKLLE